jgi:hypothetical protein
MTVEEIYELAPDALLCDGFDEAIIGVAERKGMEPVVAYNKWKIIDILMNRDGMSYEEAVEFFDFNIIDAWVGEMTPIFIQTEL